MVEAAVEVAVDVEVAVAVAVDVEVAVAVAVAVDAAVDGRPTSESHGAPSWELVAHRGCTV
ncbi:MAG: hypothetical protein R3F59_22900 [Myxococcota bacterium]